MATKIPSTDRPAYEPLTRQKLRAAKRAAQQSRRKKAPALPWKVRKGIVSGLRVAPPYTLGDVQVESAKRLGRLTEAAPGLWDLSIDWPSFATDLDHCANVRPLQRSPGEETAHHKMIAAALRKAAGYLNPRAYPGQTDPLLYGSLQFLSHAKKERYESFHLVRMITDDEPRLSELLKDLAWFFEGEEVKVSGVHRFSIPEFGVSDPKTKESRGAAVKATENVSAFFRKHTERPYSELAKKVAEAYFPRQSVQPKKSKKKSEKVCR